MKIQKYIRILHIRSAIGYGGGPDKTILCSAVEIDSSRFNLHIAYIYDSRAKEYPLYKRAKALGLSTHRILIGSRLSPSLLMQIRQLARDLDIDIIHTHGYKSDISALLASPFLGIHLVNTVHGFIHTSHRLRLYNYLNTKALRHFDRIITVNQLQRKDLIHYGISEERLVVVHNGVDPDEFSRKNISVDIRAELGLNLEEPIILYLGRLSPEKGISYLIDTMSKGIETGPPAYLLIAGVGPQEKELVKETRDRGLRERIKFLGYRQDAVNLLGVATIFVLPSLTEGIPNCVLEAMAMEVPVVATAVGGTPEILTDGQEGLLIPPKDSGELSKAISYLLVNRQKAKLMGQRGRLKVCNEISFSNRTRKIEKIYEEVMEN